MKPESGSLLVVEDHPVTGELLVRLLQERGHAVALCGDGNRALDMVASDRFDLVLLDVGVPGADGFEVLRSIRGSHTAIDLPVIMATAHGQSEMVVRALELGANDYVTKPYDPPVLLARVQTQLWSKRMAAQKAQLERTLAQRNEQLELANRALSDANRRMRADLRAARRVQEALLPPEGTTIPGVRLAWTFRPCEDLAGDTLNVFALDDEHVGLYLLDVAGHGVPAALLSVHLSLILSSPRDPSSFLVRADGPQAGRPVPPAEVVSSLNRRLAWATTERFFTLFYGVLNCQSGEFLYACAGHPGPAHLSGAGGCRILKSTGPPVGIIDLKYDQHALQLSPGDRLYLYSDGVTEATGAGEELYGTRRLTEVLVRHRAADLPESLSALIADVEGWCGGRAGDDISVLAVEFTGATLPSGKDSPALATA